jgi:hypothetical protein
MAFDAVEDGALGSRDGDAFGMATWIFAGFTSHRSHRSRADPLDVVVAMQVGEHMGRPADFTRIPRSPLTVALSPPSPSVPKHAKHSSSTTGLTPNRRDQTFDDVGQRDVAAFATPAVFDFDGAVRQTLADHDDRGHAEQFGVFEPHAR